MIGNKPGRPCIHLLTHQSSPPTRVPHGSPSAAATDLEGVKWLTIEIYLREQHSEEWVAAGKGGNEQRAGWHARKREQCEGGRCGVLLLCVWERESQAQAVSECMWACVRVSMTYLHEKGGSHVTCRLRSNIGCVCFSSMTYYHIMGIFGWQWFACSVLFWGSEQPVGLFDALLSYYGIFWWQWFPCSISKVIKTIKHLNAHGWSFDF